MRLLGSWLLGAALATAQAGGDDVFDLVIRGGRVMDPESGTDAVRDVGVTGGRIARVSEGPLAGRRVLDAKGWWSLPASSISTSMARTRRTTG